MDTTPQQRLLTWLSSHPGSWSSAQLASALGVSDRTVRNYVARLNKDAVQVIVERTPKGYRLVSSAPVKVPETPEMPARSAAQRSYRLLRHLLTSAAPVSLYELAAEMGVSEFTIRNDLRRLADEASGLNVKIIKTQELIAVAGTEAERRRLVRQTISAAADPRSILSTEDLMEAYSSYDISEIRDHVVKVLSDSGLNCNDYTLNPLILDLVIAVDRITDDHVLRGAVNQDSQTPDPRLLRATKRICEYLSKAYGVEFTETEYAGVLLLIASKTTLLKGASDHHLILEHVGHDLAEMVQQILSRLNEVYLVDLTDDSFVDSLTLHTYNLLVRTKAGHPQSNPLAAATRVSHPLVHELAVFFCRELERFTGLLIDADETGFIALHLGAALARRGDSPAPVLVTLVMPKYHNLTNETATRLLNRLGERASVVQIIESAEPKSSKILGDLVITTIPIPGVHPARQVTVGPLLNEADIEVIEARVRALQKRLQWSRRMEQLRELFDETLFLSAPSARNREEVLELLTNALLAQAAVPQDFLEQVLEREELSSTAFNDIVAIPHTLGMPATRTRIAVATFDRPIDWDGVPVRLVLLIAFSAADRGLFRETFDQLVIALTEPSNVRRLIEGGATAAEFVEALSRLMEDD